MKSSYLYVKAPLMPKATASWLIENTILTFKQIADFCQIHIAEVQAIADGEVDRSLVPFDPISNGQLTQNEVRRCESDRDAKLALLDQKSSVGGLGKRKA